MVYVLGWGLCQSDEVILNNTKAVCLQPAIYTASQALVLESSLRSLIATTPAVVDMMLWLAIIHPQQHINQAIVVQTYSLSLPWFEQLWSRK